MSELEEEKEVKEVRTHLIEDHKPYLTMEKLIGGDMKIALLMPPFDISDLKGGYKQKLTFFFKKSKLQHMQKKFKGVKQVVVFTDGACSNNPGNSGAGAVFFAK